MAKRTYYPNNNFVREVAREPEPDEEPTKASENTAIDIPVVETYTKVGHGTRKLQCKFPAEMVYVGQVTGKRYVWPGAGSVIEVDNEDCEILLHKMVGGDACCGGSKTAVAIFEEVR
jgi:hypothetical protein